MSNYEKYIVLKLLEYMRNYSINLLRSERATSVKTFLVIAKLIKRHLVDHVKKLNDESANFTKLSDDLKCFVENVDKSLIQGEFNEIDDSGSEEEFILNTESSSPAEYSSEVRKFLDKNQKMRKNKGRRPIPSKRNEIDQDLVIKLLDQLHQATNSFLEKNPIEPPERFQEIFSTFMLSDVEKELFQIVFIAEKCQIINGHVFHNDNEDREFVFAHTHNKFGIDTGLTSKKIKVQHQRIEYFTNIPHSEVRQNFNDNSKLFKTNLLENEEDPNLTYFICDYLDGNSENPILEQVFEEVDLSDVFDLETTQLDSKDSKNLKLVLGGNNGAAILLKGVPGSGKTETAKSLAKSLGVPLFILKHARKKKDPSTPPRKMGMYLIQELYKNTRAIFLLDECEDLINSQTHFFSFFMGSRGDDNLKSYINEYLDENKCNLIFIANHTKGVDDSTMRRFNYIVTFKEISTEHRERLLNNLFEKEKVTLLSADEIRSLSINSSLNIGHYGLALKSAKGLDGTLEVKKNLFLDIVSNHCKEFVGPEIILKKMNKKYSLEGLNTDHSLTELTQSIVKKNTLMLSHDSDTSLNIFLSGPPGTGKTEYVKHLAERLQKRLIIKQGSDLKDKYVGETEKRIKAAFLEAQESGAMLFIDEIDSIMYSREMATQSWEIGQVNEILVNLENFKGIFIAASNSIDRMDPASLRRFLYKIKFDYLNKEGIEHFFHHFFGDYLAKNENQIVDLSGLKKLTPSDFNTVKRKIEFEDNVSVNDIVKLLKIEMGYKGEALRKSIGINL